MSHVPGAGSEPTLHPSGPAMRLAIVQIEREFGLGLEHRLRKDALRRVLTLGAGHPGIRVRYRANAMQLRGFNLAGAIMVTEIRYRTERASFDIATACGARPPRLPLMILGELRLIMRWMRRYGRPERFQGYVVQILDGYEDHRPLRVAGAV